MEFGKTANLDEIDFTLPVDPPGNAATLAAYKTDGPAEIYLASPVWSDPGFVGKIYPKGVKSGDYFHHYSRHYNSIELNTTYYATNPAQLKKWAEIAPDDFVFCPKVAKYISHGKQLRRAHDATQAFCRDVMELGEKLGPVWLLLPPTFTPAWFHILQEWVERFPSTMQLGIEFRHPLWFSDDGARKALFEFLRKHRTIAIITDVAGRRDVLHMEVTAPSTIIRFGGNKFHNSDFERLDMWAKKLIDWSEAGLQQAFFFMHQPNEHFTVEMAIHMSKRLKEWGNIEVRAPRKLAEQTKLF